MSARQEALVSHLKRQGIVNSPRFVPTTPPCRCVFDSRKRRVQAAMERIDRRLFVTGESASSVYEDSPLPIGTQHQVSHSHADRFV